MDNLELTERDTKFLEGVLAGEELSAAGKKAGFTHAHRDAYPLLSKPAVRKRFMKAVRGRSETEGLVVAFNYIIELVRDTNNDKRLRFDAAKFLYAANMALPKSQEAIKEAEAKNPSEMTYGELRAIHDQLEQELGLRAKAITVYSHEAASVGEPDHSSIL